MKTIYWVVGILVFVVVLFYFMNVNKIKPENTPNATKEDTSVQVIPISHATAILRWGNTIVYTDPTGGAAIFKNQPVPNIIVVTDIHGDHLSVDTLNEVIGDAALIVPQAVKDQLPENLASRAQVLNNGETTTEKGFQILAIPMYNLPESADSRHTKGRGNGYIIERDSFRVYIAGDTAGIQEMRTLTNIDIALIPMNLPFTMDVAEAADAVLDFKPIKVYPYHYRGQNGLSDIKRFKELVNASDPDIEVVLADWYPQH